MVSQQMAGRDLPIQAFLPDPSSSYGASFSDDTSRHLKARKHVWLDQALRCAEASQQQGLLVSKELACRLLHECSKQQDLELGRRVQSLISDCGIDSILILNDYIIRMFASCGSLIEAVQAFDKLSEKSHYTWNAIIGAHVKLEDGKMALHLYGKMQHESTKPDMFTFSCILKACNTIGAKENGRLIHAQLLDRRLQFDVVVGNTLLDMYAKSGSLHEARRVLDKLQTHNVVSWNAMIAGYVQHGEPILAIECYKSMGHLGIKSDKFTFSSILKACASTGALDQGRYIHEHMIENGLQSGIIIGNTLIDMYAGSGSLEEADEVFSRLPMRDVVTWNAIIAAFAEHNDGYLALQCLEDMLYEGLRPNRVTFLSAIKACSSIITIEEGRRIHEQIIGYDLQSDIVVRSTLVDMYAKCGNLEEAQGTFDKLSSQDLVAWTAIIAGYSQHGESILALECYKNMQGMQMQLDKFTFSSILKACGGICLIQQGRCIHEQIIDNDLENDVVVGSALVDMYAKCGNLDEACKVFNNLSNRNVVSWNSMIIGHAQVGEPGLAIQCLEETRHKGIRPNHITFLGVFTSLGHAGLVDEGFWYLKAMIKYHGIMPNRYHVACMVDLFGHAGCFREAEASLETLVQIESCLWMILLDACNMHGNVELGKKCFDEVTCVDPSCAAAYVLMSNIYANAYMIEDTFKVKSLKSMQCILAKHKLG